MRSFRATETELQHKRPSAEHTVDTWLLASKPSMAVILIIVQVLSQAALAMGNFKFRSHFLEEIENVR